MDAEQNSGEAQTSSIERTPSAESETQSSTEETLTAYEECDEFSEISCDMPPDEITSDELMTGSSSVSSSGNSEGELVIVVDIPATSTAETPSSSSLPLTTAEMVNGETALICPVPGDTEFVEVLMGNKCVARLQNPLPPDERSSTYRGVHIIYLTGSSEGAGVFNLHIVNPFEAAPNSVEPGMSYLPHVQDVYQFVHRDFFEALQRTNRLRGAGGGHNVCSPHIIRGTRAAYGGRDGRGWRGAGGLRGAQGGRGARALRGARGNGRGRSPGQRTYRRTGQNDSNSTNQHVFLQNAVSLYRRGRGGRHIGRGGRLDDRIVDAREHEYNLRQRAFDDSRQFRSTDDSE